MKEPAPASPASDLRILDNVPGYRRALQRGYAIEERWREQSYLDLSENICGIPVRPLTWQAYRQLCRIDSPFVCGGRRPEIHDVAFFLFRISPAFERARAAKEKAIADQPGQFQTFLRRLFRRPNPSATERGAAAFIKVRQEFVEQVRGLDYFQAVRAINRFVDRMLLDRPIGSKGSRTDPADTSVDADIVHMIAGAYGWTRDYIVNLPMPEIFQALRSIQRDMTGCPKRAKARVHPLAVRFTRKHREISRAAAAESEVRDPVTDAKQRPGFQRSEVGA